MGEAFTLDQQVKLTWYDYSKLSTGVSYLRGLPHFQGTLGQALEVYSELPAASRASASISLDPKSASNGKTTLTAAEIEELKASTSGV